MYKYFCYSILNIIRKKTIYICSILYWIFFFLILYLVPQIIGMDPYYIWGSSLFNIQSVALIIFAIIISAAIVIVFRDPIDDGTELIISAKPINRWKIILAKFLSILFVGVLIIIISIAFFALSVTTRTYVKGQFWKWLPYYLLGAVVVLFFCMIVSALISLFSTNIYIMVFSVAIIILITIIHTIIPIASKTQDDWFNDHYGQKFTSGQIIKEDKDGKGSFLNYVNTNIQGDTKTYCNDARKSTNGTLLALADIGGQLSDLYKPNNKSINGFSSYGSDISYDYWIDDDLPLWDNINNKPKTGLIFMPEISSIDQQESLIYKSFTQVKTPGTEGLLNVLGLNSNKTMLYTGQSSLLNYAFIDSEFTNTYTDLDYVNYIIDKYLWYGCGNTTTTSRYGYNNLTYKTGTYGQDLSTYTQTNEPWKGMYIYKKDLSNATVAPLFTGIVDYLLNGTFGANTFFTKMNIATLLTYDKYSNGSNYQGNFGGNDDTHICNLPPIHGAYYPISGTNSTNASSINLDLIDNLPSDGETHVPNFWENFKEGKYPETTNDISSISTWKINNTSDIDTRSRLINALGPYPTLGISSENAKNFFLCLAMYKIYYQIIKRLCNIFVSPEAFYESNKPGSPLKSTDNWYTGTDEFSDQKIITQLKTPDTFLQRIGSSYEKNADQYFPNEIFVGQRSFTGAGNQDLADTNQSAIDERNKRQNYYTANGYGIYWNFNKITNFGIDQLSNTYTYDFKQFIGQNGVIMFWTFFSIIGVALIVTIFLRHDFK